MRAAGGREGATERGSVACTGVTQPVQNARQRRNPRGGQPDAPRRCLNLGSYNYLGFADDWRDTCQAEVLTSLDDFEVSLNSARADLGARVAPAPARALSLRTGTCSG